MSGPNFSKSNLSTVVECPRENKQVRTQHPNKLMVALASCLLHCLHVCILDIVTLQVCGEESVPSSHER